MNEPLISCPFLSSKLDSPVIKTLERHYFYIDENQFPVNIFLIVDVLSTGESNFDERNGQLVRVAFVKK